MRIISFNEYTPDYVWGVTASGHIVDLVRLRDFDEAINNLVYLADLNNNKEVYIFSSSDTFIQHSGDVSLDLYDTLDDAKLARDYRIKKQQLMTVLDSLTPDEMLRASIKVE